jgi:hypothetical protein
MPNYQIFWTTDGKNIGYTFESSNVSFTLPNGFVMNVENVYTTENGKRFANSNYIIDAKPV